MYVCVCMLVGRRANCYGDSSSNPKLGNEAACVSFRANNIEKGMNLSALLTAIGK